MNASDRAQFLRIKKSTPNLSITEAELVELAQLESEGHVRGSGDVKPVSSRRADPKPVAGEIDTDRKR